MTADELVSTLGALPAVRRLAAAPPIQTSVLVAGIEVASTREATENSLRRIWRERQRGGAAPLLLLADDAAVGTVLTLGVTDAGGPVRPVDSSALAQVLVGNVRPQGPSELSVQEQLLALSAGH